MGAVTDEEVGSKDADEDGAEQPHPDPQDYRRELDVSHHQARRLCESISSRPRRSRGQCRSRRNRHCAAVKGSKLGARMALHGVPAWQGPSTQIVGVPALSPVVIVTTRDVAVAATDLTVYPAGFSFNLEIRLRETGDAHRQ